MASTDTAKHLETLIGLIEDVLNAIIKVSNGNNFPQQLDDTSVHDLLKSQSSINVAKTILKHLINFGSQNSSSVTSISTADSGCSSISQPSIGSSFLKSTFSSQTGSVVSASSDVNESEPHNDQQNASEASSVVDSILSSSKVSTPADHVSSNSGGRDTHVDIDLTKPSTSKKTEEKKEQNPPKAENQSAKSQRNKRKNEDDAGNSSKKPKTADNSNDVNVTNRLECEYCNFSCTRQTVLNNHIATHHFLCEVCHKICATEEQLIDHKKSHEPPK